MGLPRRSLCVALLLAVVGLAGCGGSLATVECQGPGCWTCSPGDRGATAKGFTSSALTGSGSTALSRDDALLYAVDSDNGILAVVSTATGKKIAQAQVGSRPERVLVGADDVIYVSNRGGRSVSVVRRGAWVEADRLSVGIEPVGLALSADNSTLYVVNSTSTTDPAVGSVMAFDTCSHKQQWELQVGEEPRGIAVLEGNLAVVTLYKQGDVALVDLAAPRVVQAGSSLYARLNAKASSLDKHAPLIETLHPRGMANVIASADGRHVYVPTLFSSEGLLPALDTSGTGVAGGSSGAYGGNGCGMGPPVLDGGGASPDAGGGAGSDGGVPLAQLVRPGGPVVVAGVVAFEGSTLTPAVDDLAARIGISEGGDNPPTLFDPCGPSQFQEPTAGVVTPDGQTMLVVNHGTDNVAVVVMPNAQGAVENPNGFPGTVSSVPVGAGPTGIAISRDGSTAWVHSAFDHSVVAISMAQAAQVTGQAIPIADDILPPNVAMGRRLFFSATNPDIVDPTISVSCASCHLEGREDGHVWRFTDGPRQTPALVGRQLSKTAPFHWNGTLPALSDFMNLTVSQRMGGQGLSDVEQSAIEAFLEAAPVPDNPFRGLPLTAQQMHGAALFSSAGCGSCHAGEALTNNLFADVGTLVVSGPVPDDATTLPNGFNVPSLLGVGRTAPYLHDGSAATLKERLTRNQGANLHGATSALSSADVDDLVAYLKTL